MLNNNQDFFQVTVCRGEPINDDPAACPWIGVYRRELRYDPRTLGAGSGNRRMSAEIVIAVQEVSMESGGDCEDLLDELVKDVVDAILTDPTIKANVEMTNEVAAYYSYDALFPPSLEDAETFGNYFQTAYLTLTMEARTA